MALDGLLPGGAEAVRVEIAFDAELELNLVSAFALQRVKEDALLERSQGQNSLQVWIDTAHVPENTGRWLGACALHRRC